MLIGKVVLRAGLATILCSSAAFAQSTGAITGRVTDATGSAVPDAMVTVTNTGTGIVRNNTTSQDGLYTVPGLQVGAYEVKVEKSGFAVATRNITVAAETTSTVDFGLRVAGSAATVEVTGEVPLVETTQSVVAGSVQTSEVQNLPMLNRTFTSLVQLVPGARPAPTLDTSKAAQGAGIAIGGSDGRNLGVNVDGAENKDYLLGGPLQNYTLEGIQEFKLLAHEFGAQYPRSGGAVLEVVTKSGTNRVHGSVFAFGRNQTITAIDYFTQQSGLPKNSYDREQFGGSIGGPIIKDRWFYFGGVERTQLNFVETEPIGPYNEDVILAKAVPQIGFKPSQTIEKPVHGTQYIIKSDYQINAKNSFFTRFSQELTDAPNSQLGIAQLVSGPPHPDLTAPNTDNHHVWSIVAAENWLISNGTLNQFTFQTNKYDIAVTANNQNPLQKIDFPSFSAGSRLGVNLSFQQQEFQFKDLFSHQAGKHALKVGGDIAFFPELNIGADVIQSPGSVSFLNDPSAIVGSQAAWAANPGGCSVTTCGSYPQGFQTPGAVYLMFRGNLPGGPGGGVVPKLTNNYPDGFKNMGYFVQDDWRVTSRFTVNMGVRYDLTLNGFSQQDAANGRIYLALKAVGSPYGRLPQTPTKDFQPRLGFAWDVTGDGKNVIRAGGGIFRDNVLLASVWFGFPYNKPQLDGLFTVLVNFPRLGLPFPSPLSSYIYGVSPLPAALPPSPTSLPNGFGLNGYMLDPEATDPYTIQSHVGYTRQVTRDLAVTLNYTHILGLHEYRTQEINPVEGAWDPNAAAYGACPGGRRYSCRFQNILGDPLLLGSIPDTTTNNRSRYDEFVISVERRGRRATFQGNYTLSSAHTYGGITSGVATAGTSPLSPQNPDQLISPGEWGPTTTDERHRVVVSGVFNLWKGIQVSPIVQAASARPYNLTQGFDPTGNNNSAYRLITNPATGATVSVNSQRGDPTFDLDLRATKSFRLKSDTRSLNFFVELYNLTNRANFGNLFGGNFASPTNFEKPIGYLAGYPSSRQMQLGARFTF